MTSGHCDYLQFTALINKLKRQGKLDCVILTDSMSPIILPKQIVAVSAIDRKLRLFDSIIFWQNNQLVAHYIWHIIYTENGDIEHLLTRSLKDPCHNDLPILPKNILGFLPDVKISLYYRILIYSKILLKRAL